MSKKKLETIKSGVFSRGLALAKLTVGAGTKAAQHAIGTAFSNDQDREKNFQKLLLSQAGILAKELGQLKGSLMKAGQMLSVMGEHMLPPEVNAVLKTLQSDSPPLGWPAVQRALQKRLGEKLDLLEIDSEPLAAASLGQVHRARIKATGREIVLKIQYPGVDRAIDSDIQTLKRILSMSRLLPGGPSMDAVFEEVRMMLKRETDYLQELEQVTIWRERLKDDPRYLIPEAIPEFSGPKVLALSLEQGVTIDSPEVLGLSQDRRNALGQAALDLYLRELFEFRSVQTDPHLGNYRVRIGTGTRPDTLILFDFGAVRELPVPFVDAYRVMVQGSFHGKREDIRRGAAMMGFLKDEDPAELEQVFVDLCELVTEPFLGQEPYDFGKSDLPMRAIKKGSELALKFKLRPPPPELVFLDRKMGGVYTFLKVLDTRFPGGHLVEKYLK